MPCLGFSNFKTGGQPPVARSEGEGADSMLVTSAVHGFLVQRQGGCPDSLLDQFKHHPFGPPYVWFALQEVQNVDPQKDMYPSGSADRPCDAFAMQHSVLHKQLLLESDKRRHGHRFRAQIVILVTGGCWAWLPLLWLTSR